jgi:bidirectional [NiFe] hydrogenase diaphorase subunit
MGSNVATAASPNQDKRWKLVDATMRRVGQHSRGLIETLHTVQEAFGYLDEQALRYVAMALRVPFSRAYGVATFYHFFTLRPAGKHACAVCTGTACHIKGSAELLAIAERQLGIQPGDTTPGGEVSLLSERWIGPCGLGPVVVYDEEVTAEETVPALATRLKHWTTP